MTIIMSINHIIVIITINMSINISDDAFNSPACLVFNCLFSGMVILCLFHFCLVWLNILVYAYQPDHNDRTKEGDRSTLSHVHLTKTALDVQLSARVALSDHLKLSHCNLRY